MSKAKAVAQVPVSLMSRQIKYVSPKALHVASFQPPLRTSAKNIAGLQSEIASIGILNPIHALQNGAIADGHRRLACAIALHMDAVPVIYHQGTDQDLPALWARLNRDTKKIDGGEWMYMWFHSEPSCDLKATFIPTLVMSKIRQCWDVFGGKDGIAFLLHNRFSPFAGQRSKEVFLWIERFESLKGELTPQKIGSWVLRHGKSSLNGIDFAYRLGTSAAGNGSHNIARRVVAAIKHDKPLTEADLRIRLASKNVSRARSNLATNE